MKNKTMIRKLLCGMVVTGLLVISAVSSKADATPVRQQPQVKPNLIRVILVPVTGSNIPQRCYIYGGQQLNSASPVYVIQASNPLRSGATSVGSLLAYDPDVTFGPTHR